MDVIGDNMVTFRRNIKELNGNSKTEKYKNTKSEKLDKSGWNIKLSKVVLSRK